MANLLKTPPGFRRARFRTEILGILTELLFTCGFIALAFALSIVFYSVRR